MIFYIVCNYYCISFFKKHISELCCSRREKRGYTTSSLCRLNDLTSEACAVFRNVGSENLMIYLWNIPGRVIGKHYSKYHPTQYA